MPDTITIRDSNGVMVDVSVDDITALNGVPVTGLHLQRFKLVFGSDGSGQDVDATHPLPVVLDPATLAALETIQVANLPGTAAAVSYGSGTTNQAGVAPADAPGRLMGYAVRETTATPGATAMVRFRSGTTVSGTLLGAGVTVGANESVREWFGPAGINVPTAVFLERVSGSTEVTVYWAAA
jgi:hypothetical protein